MWWRNISRYAGLKPAEMYGRMSSVLGCLEIRLASDHEGGEYIEDDFLDGRPKSVQRLAKKILRITKLVVR